MKSDADKLKAALDYIAYLKGWIREEGERAGVCTYNVLAELCKGCGCPRKTVVDGITFDSFAESRRYQDLKLMERAGEISGLCWQIGYPIDVNGVQVCSYVADFVYFRGQPEYGKKAVVEDVKGIRKGAAWALFRLKAKLFAATYGQEIEVYPPPPPRAPRKAKR